MASIAVLPILIGLAVDYAIQFQARFDEAVDERRSRAPRRRRLAAARGGPAIATACLATAAGFLALQLSPTPMVRSFGLLLVVGVADRLPARADRGFAALSACAASGGARGTPARARRSRCPRCAARRRGATAPAHASPRRPQRSRRRDHQPRAGPRRRRWRSRSAAGWPAPGSRPSPTSASWRRRTARGAGPERAAGRRPASPASSTSSSRSPRPHRPGDDRAGWRGFKQRVLEQNGFRGEFPSCRKARDLPGPALSDFVADAAAARVSRAADHAPCRGAAALRPAPGGPARSATGLPATRAASPSGSAPSRSTTSRR